MNEFTRRHLEFYYRDVLRMTRAKALPRQVNVLVDLVPQATPHLLPVGTMLLAGHAPDGSEIHFRTDNDLVVGHAQVAELRSLRVERKTITLQDVFEQPELLDAAPGRQANPAGGRDKVYWALMALALGDSIFSYRPKVANNEPSDFLVGCELMDELVEYVRGEFKMPLAAFQQFITLANRLNPTNEPAKDKWKKLAVRFGISSSESPIETPEGFESSLKEKLDQLQAEGAANAKSYQQIFSGIPEVSNVFELHRQHQGLQARKHQLSAADREFLKRIETVIEHDLLLTVGDFDESMTTIESIQQEWHQLVDLLRMAGHEISGFRNEHLFIPRMNRLLLEIPARKKSPEHDQLTELEEIDKAFEDLSVAFHMSLADWSFVREVVRDSGASESDKSRVLEILEAAHREQQIKTECAELKTRKEKSFAAMIAFAMEQSPQLSPSTEKSDSAAPSPNSAIDFMQLNPSDEIDQRYIRTQLQLDPITVRGIQDLQRRSESNLPEDSESDSTWEKAYRQLVLAKWRRQRIPLPVPEIDVWENVFVAEDATSVRGRHDVETENLRWRTFGGGHADSGVTTAEFGIAIASPLLTLTSGDRLIKLKLSVTPGSFKKAQVNLLNGTPPFRVLFSTAKGMHEVAVSGAGPDRCEIKSAPTADSLEVQIKLSPKAPGIVPLPPGPQAGPKFAVVQLLLDNRIGKGKFGASQSAVEANLYPSLAQCQISQVELEVSVGRNAHDQENNTKQTGDRPTAIGLSPAAIQNDHGRQDPTKPFEPFGAVPAVGSRLLIAHPELASKSLTKLAFSTQWMGQPDEGIGPYYASYFDPVDSSTRFNISVSVLENGFPTTLADALPLFSGSTPGSSDELINVLTAADATVGNTEKLNTGDHTTFQSSDELEEDLTRWPRAFQWKLNSPDFQHLRYPVLAAEKAMELAARVASQPRPTGTEAEVDRIAPKNYHVNPPYTPVIGELRIHYTAREVFKPGTEFAAGRIYHVEPFGYRRVPVQQVKSNPPSESKGGVSETSVCHLLPQFINEGELFIGLDGVQEPQTVSLLFQLADGSGDPQLPHAPVHWSYLNGEEWIPFGERQILRDSTDGLVKTGIIVFDVPTVFSGILMPPDKFWIRATVPKNSRSVCDTINIHTQAVCATRVLSDDPTESLGPPLEPNSITDLQVPQPEIDGIRQPYSSFGGRDVESAGHFYTRVSERLRHRNRVLTAWDCEHMVLEAFPEIYKVKCLPVGTSDDPSEANTVRVVVIPDIRNKLPSDPFQPRAAADKLKSIEQYLQQHSSPMVNYRVLNPRYVPLTVRAVVRFRDGCNPAFYRPRLNDELVHYLAPWAYDQAADIMFGNRVDLYHIVNFIEKRHYVDFVAHITTPGSDSSGGPPSQDVVYVSSRSHIIEEFDDQTYERQVFSGIGYMKVGVDFHVG
ncbi:MAG: hypothetical protein KDA88_06430 [Planctomycetaceae bacterium]|nr:hypothetical protein [Planctomycetaceae bacterium]MCB9950063.1 hypothetical protein [Planctomycetaceae bacterium]